MHDVKNILKNFDFKIGPYKIFDKKIVNFLNEISNRILKSKKYNQYTDLATFAFWCRKKNIEALSNTYSSSNLILGRGCVLHICPSNVPMNFAYSLAFGLISEIIILLNFHQEIFFR